MICQTQKTCYSHFLSSVRSFVVHSNPNRAISCANKHQGESMATDRKPEFFAGKDLKIGIIGCGYVGLPLALRFADVGHRVTGFDLDQKKVDTLNAGGSYIQHIPANKISAHVKGGRFGATT